MKKLIIAALLFSCQTVKKEEAPRTVVTYWGAEWCPACVKYKPVVKAEAEACGAIFQENNTDVEGLVEKSQFDIYWIPVFTVSKNNKISYHGPYSPRLKDYICESENSKK